MKTEPLRFGSRPKMCLMPTGENWRVKELLWTSIYTDGYDSSMSRNSLNLYNLPRCLQCYKCFCGAALCSYYHFLSVCDGRPGGDGGLGSELCSERPERKPDWKQAVNYSRACCEVRALLRLDLVLKLGCQRLVKGWATHSYVLAPSFYIHWNPNKENISDIQSYTL